MNCFFISMYDLHLLNRSSPPHSQLQHSITATQQHNNKLQMQKYKKKEVHLQYGSPAPGLSNGRLVVVEYRRRSSAVGGGCVVTLKMSRRCRVALLMCCHVARRLTMKEPEKCHESKSKVGERGPKN